MNIIFDFISGVIIYAGIWKVYTEEDHWQELLLMKLIVLVNGAMILDLTTR